MWIDLLHIGKYTRPVQRERVGPWTQTHILIESRSFLDLFSLDLDFKLSCF